MRDKITYLMKSEGLTTTRLAEILEIQPSAVSHLVSGRNKPGYDLLQKILRRFPRINPDWLLLDSDIPYRSENDSNESKPVENADACLLPFDLPTKSNKMPISIPTIKSSVDTGNNDSSTNSKSPIFVVVFYDDGSCENYSMRG